MADQHGNCIHLFERECSIQRRHQKVVEEAPSVFVTPDIRQQLGDTAVRITKACGYVGAGTVEFLMDADRNFYFLEMNTRLQVEHPVTEFITGLDLVELQIRIARGEALPVSQEDLTIKGHAIELRVCAEDPENDFLPSIGVLQKYRPPQLSNVRVDDGYREGMEIPIFYDPLLAKLIVYAPTRSLAIDLMTRAIDRYEVEGASTTLPFGRFVMASEAFRSGSFDTHFVKEQYTPEKSAVDPTLVRVAALVAGHLQEARKAKVVVATNTNQLWKENRNGT
jgi:acetyl/propionyl-CoA carboxylase alpha subunit